MTGGPGENHKLLAQGVGTWDYKLKFWWSDPGAPPMESSGVAVRKADMDGRYFILDTTGTMQMPGPDGKMQTLEFKGRSTDGYDNVKKKFVSSWIDNMGTSILLAEGTYDPASKTFTYDWEEELTPGVKTHARETIKLIDKDHDLLEWFEKHDGVETKTMEISYTRKE